MNRRIFTAGCVFILLSIAASGRADAESVTGQWTVSASDIPGKVAFGLNYRSEAGGESTNRSDWNPADLKGLDLSTPARHDVTFVIDREAGRFEGQGFVMNGEGAGIFHFTPSSSYAKEMSALGFTGFTMGQQIAFAAHDVSLAFAKDMKALNLDGLTAGTLLAFRIHNVDRAYISSLRAAGVEATSAGHCIAFRIHGVTPDYVQSLHALGFKPNDGQLIALRVQGVTPDYIAGLQAHGLKNVSVGQLIALRAQGIN